MGRSLSVGIAGCGIAGLSTALFLHRAGHKPVIFDNMSAPGPVGSGLLLQPTGLAVLDELGLLDEVREAGQPVDRLFGLSGGRAVLDVRYNALDASCSALAIHRAALFGALYGAAKKAGIEMHFGVNITGYDAGRLVAETEDLGSFDIVVNALGARSTLNGTPFAPLKFGALWGTFDWPKDGPFNPSALEQRYVKARRMVGILPCGTLLGSQSQKLTFFWSLKNTEYAAWREAGLDIWKSEVAALWPETQSVLDQILSPDQLAFAQYTHQTTRPPYSGRLVHIGDSYHAASPQLGQGANMALLDAYAFAQALQANPDRLDDALKAYYRARRHHVRLYQWMAWLFTPVYQSESRIIPFLRDFVAGPASRIWPMPALLATIVSGQIGRPLSPLSLSPPALTAPLADRA